MVTSLVPSGNLKPYREIGTREDTLFCCLINLHGLNTDHAQIWKHKRTHKSYPVHAAENRENG